VRASIHELEQKLVLLVSEKDKTNNRSKWSYHSLYTLYGSVYREQAANRISL